MDNQDSDEKIPEEVFAAEMAQMTWDPNTLNDIGADDQNDKKEQKQMQNKENKDKEESVSEKSNKKVKKFMEGNEDELNQSQEPELEIEEGFLQQIIESEFTEETQQVENIQTAEDSADNEEEEPEQEESQEIGFAEQSLDPMIAQFMAFLQWQKQQGLLQMPLNPPIDPQEPGFPADPQQFVGFPQWPIPGQQGLPLIPQLFQPIDGQQLQNPINPILPLVPQMLAPEEGEEPAEEPVIEIPNIPPDLIGDLNDDDVIVQPVEGNIEMNRFWEQFNDDDVDNEDDEEERIRRLLRNRKIQYIPNDFNDILNRGLRNHRENQELFKINSIIKGNKVSDTSSQEIEISERVECSIGRLNTDELLFLLRRFSFEGQVILLTVFSQWQHILNMIFKKQTYLWFSKVDESSRRFLPIEDCCESCHFVMDYQPVIRVNGDSLLKLIKVVLSLTPNLKCLRLYRFNFDKSLFVSKLVETCPQLKHIDLTESKGLTLAVMRKLGQSYPHLKHLILSSTQIEEELLKPIVQSMKMIETLIVNCTHIKGDCLKYLPNTLKRLDIRCCPDLILQNLVDLFRTQRLHRLHHLKIDAKKNIRSVIKSIGEKQKNLILFEVSQPLRRERIPTTALADILQLTSLKSLKIGKTVNLDSEILGNIMQACYRMRSFSIEIREIELMDPLLRETSFQQMPQFWPLLERLEIVGATNFQLTSIEPFQQMANLYYLNLTECTGLEDENVGQVLTNFSKLNYLVLDKCNRLGKKTLDAAILKARRMSYEIFRVSMIRCNLSNLPYLKGKLLPNNLRLTFSSNYSRRYHTFDGIRTRSGRIEDIHEILNAN